MEEEIKKTTQEYLKVFEELKNLKETKNLLESKLKLLMEQNELKTLQTNNYKISFLTYDKSVNPKNSEIMELFHKKLLNNEKTRGITEEIMNQVREDLESGKKVKSITSLRVS